MKQSLRLRLLIGAALWSALALGLAGMVLLELFRDHARGQMIERLTADLEQLTAHLEGVEPGQTPYLSAALSDSLYQRPLSGLYWQVERGEAVLLRSRSLWDGVLTASAKPLGPREEPLLQLRRSVYFPDSEVPLVLTVAQDESHLQELAGAFGRTLTVSFVLLALGVLAAAWGQVAYGLRPLKRLRERLAAIHGGTATRLEGDWPREIAPLVADLNQVLDHNARMVADARTHAGNLAHALKTPLAVIGNEATSLAAQGDNQSAALIQAQTEAMRRHITHHLARARAQAAGETHGLRTPPAPSLARLARTLARLHPVVPQVVCDPGAPSARLDQQTLEEMLGNLMENACQWAEARVEVRASRGADGGLVLTIEDDGPGIPEDQRETALRRGLRLDESRPGNGLGLSIVADLAEAAGGRLSLDRSERLGGLRAVLTLPAGGGLASSAGAEPPPP